MYTVTPATGLVRRRRDLSAKGEIPRLSSRRRQELWRAGGMTGAVCHVSSRLSKRSGRDISVWVVHLWRPHVTYIATAIFRGSDLCSDLDREKSFGPAGSRKITTHTAWPGHTAGVEGRVQRLKWAKAYMIINGKNMISVAIPFLKHLDYINNINKKAIGV